jgi:simple sugar transport system permease protein
MVAAEVLTLEAAITGAVAAGTIYLLAATGEVLTERSGILNLGLEGIMLMGAATSFIFTLSFGHLAGVVASMVVGALMALLLVFFVVTLRLNQVVTGLALTMFGAGLSGFIGAPEVRRSIVKMLNPSVPEEVVLLNQAPRLPDAPIPLLKDLPIVGKAFFSHNLIVYASLIFAILLWVLLFRTKWGLSIRSVGENPAMADALGVNVYRIRYLSTMIGGALGGLSGAYLFLGYQPFWVEQITRGRGFIALALVILAAWSPLRAILVAYLFGGIEAFQYRVPLLGLGAQTPQFVLMLPYAVTILTLVILSFSKVRRRIGAPAALGLPYSREE